MDNIKILNNIVGMKLNNIIFQPTEEVFGDNLIIINFGKKIEYSIHVFCLFRVLNESEILLTSTDIYFSDKYERISFESYSEDNFIKKSLLLKNISAVKNSLKGAKVESIKMSSTGDIFIKFDNGIIFEILIDCLYQNYEYYRVIDSASDKHYVVKFDKNNIYTEVI